MSRSSRTRRNMLHLTGATGGLLLAGCLANRQPSASTSTPVYEPHDFYFGFEGYQVDSTVSIHDGAAPLSYTIDRIGNVVDNEQSVAFEFTVANDGQQTVSTTSSWPAPFGFFELENEETRRTIRPWSDAYGDRISPTRGPRPRGDTAVPREIDPGETLTETYELANDTHGIATGTYQFETEYTVAEPGEHDAEWSVHIEMEVEIDRLDNEPESDDRLRDIVVREVTDRPDFGGTLDVDVLAPITNEHPGLIDIAFVSNWAERTVVTAEPGFPFESYVGEAADGNQLVIMPVHMYAPGHVERKNECWRARFLPGSDRRSIRSKTGFDPGERRVARYIVSAPPRNDGECLAPVEYKFSQHFSRDSQQGEAEAGGVELGFTLALQL